MSNTCHKCGGAGWAVGSPQVCTACNGTGRPDGQLSPHEVLMMADLDRLRTERRERHRTELGLLAGLFALTAAAACILSVVMQAP